MAASPRWSARSAAPELAAGPPAPACRRGRGDDRSAAAALAQAGRRSAGPAVRRRHPLADRLRAVRRRWRCRRSDAPAGTSSSPASAAAQPMTGYWRPPMPRLASLFLPGLAIDRIRRSEWSARRRNSSSCERRSCGGGPHEVRWRGLLEAFERACLRTVAAGASALPIARDREDSASPRAPGFRPGARWSRDEEVRGCPQPSDLRSSPPSAAASASSSPQPARRRRRSALFRAWR